MKKELEELTKVASQNADIRRFGCELERFANEANNRYRDLSTERILGGILGFAIENLLYLGYSKETILIRLKETIELIQLQTEDDKKRIRAVIHSDEN
jgi:hypothetical protein